MTSLVFLPLDTATVEAYRAGAPDANGQKPERRIAQTGGLPCRHCLQDIAEGEAYLTLAHRPFPAAQPYAEVGPIFLHAEACPRYEASTEVPPVFLARERIMLRGYGADDRIVYGTGTVIPVPEMTETARRILAQPGVAYVHARSASNNCYQCRIEG